MTSDEEKAHEDAIDGSDWKIPPLTKRGHLAAIDLDNPRGISVTVRVPVSETIARRLAALMLTTGNNISVTFPPLAAPSESPALSGDKR